MTNDDAATAALKVVTVLPADERVRVLAGVEDLPDWEWPYVKILLVRAYFLGRLSVLKEESHGAA